MKKTKGILLSSILALGLSTSAFAGEGSSGAFVGIHTGATMMVLKTYPITMLDTRGLETVFNIGVKAGYQHFFHPIVGLRGYINYDFNMQRSLIKNVPGGAITPPSFMYHNITANADLLVNFFSSEIISIGAYVGFGLGYGIDQITGSGSQFIKQTLKQVADYNGFNIPVNLGLTVTLFENHQIELGAKIQTLAAGYTLKADKSSGIYINPYVVNIGYSYIF